jgi:hypothetical protein
MRDAFAGVIIAVASGCQQAPPIPPEQATEAKRDPAVDRAVPFEGRLEVSQTYRAELVYDMTSRTWLPVPHGEGAIGRGDRAEWMNPELLARFMDRDPTERWVVFEVVSRDIDHAGRGDVYRCRILEAGPSRR